MSLTRWLLCATLLVSAACGGGSDDDGTPDAGGGGGADAAVDAGQAGIKLETWVHQLVTERMDDSADPDTVEDKVIIDTENEAAFDEYLSTP